MQKINEHNRSPPQSQKNQLASSLKQIKMPQEPISVFLKCTWGQKSSFNHISTIETMKKGGNCEFKDNVNLGRY